MGGGRGRGELPVVVADDGGRGAPGYPTVVARIPGCLRSVSDGSQKHPMPKVASRAAPRGAVLRNVGAVDERGHADASNENERPLMGVLARRKIKNSSEIGDVFVGRYGSGA